MASLGPVSPGTVITRAIGAVDWTNPGNITASDNVYATNALNANSSYWLEASNFDFSALPGTATIDGIVAEWEGKTNTGSVLCSHAMAKTAGGSQATPAGSGAVGFSTSEAYHTVGGTTDNPGSYTAAEVKASTFNVLMRVNFQAGVVTTSVDHVRVTIYYTDIQTASIVGVKASITAVGNIGVFQQVLSVAGQKATATAGGNIGSITTVRIASITGVTATATATANSGVVSNTIFGVTATATATGLLGTVTALSSSSITGVKAAATSSGNIGSVTAQISALIAGITATATATGYATGSPFFTAQPTLSSLVTFVNGVSSIKIELDVDVEWKARFTREFGNASIFVPRNSAAFSSTYIDENGGFLVKIDHPTQGQWRGIANVPSIDARGATVTATEIGILTTIRNVSVNKVFTGITAGAIARAAITDALGGLSHPYLLAGSFLEAAPHIPQYTFSGQSLAQVLGDLMEMTGQEWEISTEYINWIPAGSSLYATHLCDDGDIVNGSKSGSLDNTVSEVIGRGSDGKSMVVSVPAQGYWSKQEAVSVDSKSTVDIAFQAKASLDQRQLPTLTYTGSIRSEHWALREGDIVMMHLPYAGLTGSSPVARIASRSYRAGDEFLSAVLQYPAYADVLNAARLSNSSVVVHEAPAPGIIPSDTCANYAPPLVASFSTATRIVQSTADGTPEAQVDVTPAAITDGCFDHYIIRYRRNGATYYSFQHTYIQAGTTIGALLPGVTYNINVAAVGTNGVVGAYAASDTNVAMPADTSAPATPTGLAATAGIKDILILWNRNTEKDLAYYLIERSSNNSTWVTRATVDGTFYRDPFTGTSAETWYYRVAAYDFSGNASSATSSVNATTSKINSGIGSGDIAPTTWSAGTFTVELTIGAGGKIKFGSGATDYITNDVIHFEVGSGDTAKVEFKNGANSPYSTILGSANSTTSAISFVSYYDSDTLASHSTIASSTLTQSSVNAQYSGSQHVEALSYASNTEQLFEVVINGTIKFKVENGLVTINDVFKFTGASTIQTATGVMPSATLALVTKDASGNDRYIPMYRNYSGWGA